MIVGDGIPVTATNTRIPVLTTFEEENHMFRIMFDSIDPEAIPRDAQLVGGYVNGPESQWPASAWRLFPQAAFVRINVTGDPSAGGDMLDVERFDASPDQAPRWFDGQPLQAGLGIYCSRDTLPAVEQAMGERKYWRWVATLDGTLHITGYKPLQGPAAVQCLGAAQLGISADLSIVIADDFHPQPTVAQLQAKVRSRADFAAAQASALDQLIATFGV